jgi:transcriptional regulator with XRE-family HTH domain
MSIDVTPTATGSLTQRVAAQIRAYMAYNQVRQSKLARDMGVNEQWLSVRLRGVQPIDLNDLERIASALGAKVGDLLPRTERTPTVTSVEPSTPIHGVPSFDNHPRGGRPSNRTDRRRPTSTTRPAQHGLARTA